MKITPRQNEIIYWVSEGLTTEEIAVKLHISGNTVNKHRKDAMLYYKANNMGHMVKRWILDRLHSGKPLTPMLVLFPLLMFGQPDTLCLTGPLAGTYTAQKVIKVDSAHSYVLPVVLQIGSCDTLDNLIPGIGLLGDDCIRDEEWEGITGYANVLTDSAAFFTLEAMEFFKFVGNFAADDCGIDSFYVKSLVIDPPGGVDRPGETIRQFLVTFRAVDWTGKFKEAEMPWTRVPNDYGCW